MISVDNLGIVIIDLSRMEMAGTIEFKKYEKFYFPEFSIIHIIPISDDGVRVILKDKGEFSIYWEKIEPSLTKNEVLTGIHFENWFETLKNQVSSLHVAYTSKLIIQLNYYQRKDGFYDGAFRVYNHMNHNNSKVYKEYIIEKIQYCKFLDYTENIQRVTIICGPKFYVYYIPTYANLTMTNDHPYSVDFQLRASNSYSTNIVNISLSQNSNSLKSSNWATASIFFAILVGGVLIIR